VSGRLVIAMNRAVQYVPCVMHNCIMVKIGGKRKTYKVCKTHVNFTKSGGEIWKSSGEKKISGNRGENDYRLKSR